MADDVQAVFDAWKEYSTVTLEENVSVSCGWLGSQWFEYAEDKAIMVESRFTIIPQRGAMDDFIAKWDAMMREEIPKLVSKPPVLCATRLSDTEVGPAQDTGCTSPSTGHRAHVSKHGTQGARPQAWYTGRTSPGFHQPSQDC